MLSTFRTEAALLVAVATTLILYTVGEHWFYELSNPLILSGLFFWVFVVMLWAAFSAVRHADELAEHLGEPYGTLVLTISVISIEVAVISSVVLTGAAAPTLARDTMMAVLMIVLNGVVGVSLLIGGLRYHEQDYNLPGARAFLAVLITLATISLILPNHTVSTEDASLTSAQAIMFSVVTVSLYVAFLVVQTIRHRSFFTEPELLSATDDTQDEDEPHADSESGSIWFHAILLVLTMVPIVLLSKKLAILWDAAAVKFSAPTALGGVVVALLVLSPEGLAAFRSASANHLQRAVNICLGSALATISLTVPVVVVIGLLTNTHIVLGLNGAEMVLLLLTFVVSIITFGGTRTSILQGAVHLVIFFVYLILIFDP